MPTAPTTPSSLPVQDTGPYLCTVLEPCGPCDESGELWIQDEPEHCSRETCERCAGEGARVVSRRAFVALDEQAIYYSLYPYRLSDSLGVAQQIARLPHGGSLTLPDGTIEVEAISLEELDRRLTSLMAAQGKVWTGSIGRVVAAFNAAQENGDR